jgi:hypothetical protein
MKIITVEMVRDWGPCYDPADIVYEDWEGTAADVLALAQKGEVSADDAFWVVLREDILDESVLREFARWCALSVAHLWDMPDVVRAYLETGDEKIRASASDAASDAAWAAAWAAARAAQLEQLVIMIRDDVPVAPD